MAIFIHYHLLKFTKAYNARPVIVNGSVICNMK